MKRNLYIAFAFVAILVVWLLSGVIFSKKDLEGEAMTAAAVPQFSVRVREQHAETVQQEVVVSAKTAPNRTVTLRAEIEARVIALGVERGANVKLEDVIAVLDEQDFPEKLNQAEALLAQRSLEYDAAKDLLEKKYQSEARVAEALVSLELARANVKQITLDLKNTKIVAPFDGTLYTRAVEVGDFLSIGDPIAVIVDRDPFIVEADVTEKQITGLKPNMPGTAKLASGEVVEGRLRYIAPQADSRSRTFAVELEVSNPQKLIPVGETAQLTLPIASIQAHKVSPATLTLDTRGNLGVKVVDDKDVVQFIPAQIEKSSQEAVWLSGLPAFARIITLGQEFVKTGESVTIVLEQ